MLNVSKRFDRESHLIHTVNTFLQNSQRRNFYPKLLPPSPNDEILDYNFTIISNSHKHFRAGDKKKEENNAYRVFCVTQTIKNPLERGKNTTLQKFTKPLFSSSTIIEHN